MTTNYSVEDAHGNQLTTGLQEHEARKVAQRMANDRAASVWLSVDVEDSELVEVQPSPTAAEAAAEADIVAAIDQSRMQSEIVHIEWSVERESELLGHAEDHAEASPTVLEAWGTDDDGTEWRVHMDGPRG